MSVKVPSIAELAESAEATMRGAVVVEVASTASYLPEDSRDELVGTVDFDGDRGTLSRNEGQVLTFVGQTVYERQADGQWTEEELPAESRHFYDPRQLLEAVRTGLFEVDASPERLVLRISPHELNQHSAVPFADSVIVTLPVVLDAGGRIAEIERRVQLIPDRAEWQSTRFVLRATADPRPIEPPRDVAIVPMASYVKGILTG